MLTDIGKPDYPMPDVAAVKSAKIIGQRGKDIPLVFVKPDVMQCLRDRWKNVRGVPVYASFDSAKRLLWLHPAPQGEFQIDLEQVDAVDEPGRLRGTITRPVTVAK